MYSTFRVERVFLYCTPTGSKPSQPLCNHFKAEAISLVRLDGRDGRAHAGFRFKDALGHVVEDLRVGVHQDLPEGGLDAVREVLFAALRSGSPRGRGHVFLRGLVELRLEVAELLRLVLCKISSIPVRNVAPIR